VRFDYVVPSLDSVVWKLGGTDFQYQPEDTGLPVLPEAAAQAEPRDDWVPTVDEDPAIRKTLELVVRAVQS
jgi:hypothetical protein